MSDTPLYDQLVNERLGRGPSEFEGHDTWDDSEEARAAFERGAAQARALEERAAGPEQTDTGKQSTAKPGLEKAPDRKQLEQQPVGEQQTRTPGKPLTPA
ncbi:hypothetical protein ACWDWO_21250 [Actinopolymorpha singaporensis]